MAQTKKIKIDNQSCRCLNDLLGLPVLTRVLTFPIYMIRDIYHKIEGAILDYQKVEDNQKIAILKQINKAKVRLILERRAFFCEPFEHDCQEIQKYITIIKKAKESAKKVPSIFDSNDNIDNDNNNNNSDNIIVNQNNVFCNDNVEQQPPINPQQLEAPYTSNSNRIISNQDNDDNNNNNTIIDRMITDALTKKEEEKSYTTNQIEHDLKSIELHSINVNNKDVYFKCHWGGTNQTSVVSFDRIRCFKTIIHNYLSSLNKMSSQYNELKNCLEYHIGQ